MNPLPGDLMFCFWPGGPLSEAIAFATHAKISHVQMIVDIGASGTLQVVSAEKQGLIDRWVMPEQYPWSCILTYDWDNTFYTNTEILFKRNMIAKWMVEKVGTPYDILGLLSFIINVDINDERKSFCSEINFQAYQAGGVELLNGVDHCYISPRDLWISPLLITLDGNVKEVR